MQSNFLGEKPLGHAQITNLTASTLVSSVSGGIPVGTSLILIQPQTQAVRWRDDGTAPTAAIGYPLSVGAELRYTAANAAALRFIEQTPSATINIAFYG